MKFYSYSSAKSPLCGIVLTISLSGIFSGLSPAHADTTLKFSQQQVTLAQSPTDLDRQREAEQKLKDEQNRINDSKEREREHRRYETYPDFTSPIYPTYPREEDRYPKYRGQFSRPEQAGIFSFSAGFKDGNLNPAIGYRLPDSNIGFEVGAALAQDALPPGNLNNYAAGSLIQQFPNGFNNLGVKTTSPNIGVDVLGYFKVSPQVDLRGGVGVYFQGRSQITQSKATTDLFKETNETNVSLALSGGADFRVTDSLRIGAGYHSLRGVTATIGYSF
jgi:hypothetical protein